MITSRKPMERMVCRWVSQEGALSVKAELLLPGPY